MDSKKSSESGDPASSAINESALIDAYERALGNVQKELRSDEKTPADVEVTNSSSKRSEPESNVTASLLPKNGASKSSTSNRRELVSYADLFDDGDAQATKRGGEAKSSMKRDAKSSKSKQAEASPKVTFAAKEPSTNCSESRQSSGVCLYAKRKWAVGDFCVATFTEDGTEYPARVISIDAASQTCVVHYLAYENEEEQPLIALRRIYEDSNSELASDDANAQQSSDWTAVPFVPPQGLSEHTEQQEALSNMLNAWYTAGYQTGYYVALQQKANKH